MTEEKKGTEDSQEIVGTGEDDDTDLGISVGIENGNVIIVYSQKLTTVSMPPEAAEKMGNALLKHAADARVMTGT